MQYFSIKGIGGCTINTTGMTTKQVALFLCLSEDEITEITQAEYESEHGQDEEAEDGTE